MQADLSIRNQKAVRGHAVRVVCESAQDPLMKMLLTLIPLRRLQIG